MLEAEINAYIKIDDEMNQRIADARAKVAEYDTIIESLANKIAQKFGTKLSQEDMYGM